MISDPPFNPLAKAHPLRQFSCVITSIKSCRFTASLVITSSVLSLAGGQKFQRDGEKRSSHTLACPVKSKLQNNTHSYTEGVCHHSVVEVRTQVF